MKITFYGYNTFIIEVDGKKIAIDPGALCFYYFRFTTLIPKSEWRDITHILVTHGDPDHYWHTDRVAAASKAMVVLNDSMISDVPGEKLALGPRAKGVAFTTHFDRVTTLVVDEEKNINGLLVKGIKATHGPLTLKLGPFSKTVTPGENERIGWGAIGFSVKAGDKTFVNLGDTLLHKKEWENISAPDVLMIPIGGRTNHNTMDEKEALEAVNIIRPRLVIPCHYNCPVLFTRHYNPADDIGFKRDVERLGYDCTVLSVGESVVL